MQQQPNNLNSPAVEVALIAIAGVLILIGAVLLYLGRIDIGFASFIFMAALSLLGINLAYKVPSPGQVDQQNAQQVQQNAQLQNVSSLLSQALAVLPMFANLLHTHAPAPVAPLPPQGQVTVNTPPVASTAGTAPTTMVRQLVQQPPVVQQVPVQQPAPQGQAQQFKPPVFTPLPDISMPMAAMPAQQPPVQQS